MAPNRQRFADARYKPLIRCAGQLAPGVTFSNGNTLYEIHNVGGCARVSARIYCPTGGGNIYLYFLGPDGDIDRIISNAPAWSIAGYGEGTTVYATGNPTPVAVGSATEAQIISECYGEGYVAVVFVANAGGAVGYCDVSRV